MVSQQINFGQTISFKDDAPTLTSVADLSVNNTVQTYSGNHIGFSYGADQAGSITLTHLTNIAGITYSGDGTRTVTASVNGHPRSEEHTYKLQPLMRTSNDVLCLTHKHTLTCN